MKDRDIMRISQKELNFISQIYDAVLEPENWLNTIDSFSNLVGAKAAMLSVVDHVYSQHEYTVASEHYRNHPDFDRLSKEYFEYVWLKEQRTYEYLVNCPNAGFVTDYSSLGFESADQLANHAPTHWLKKHFGFYYRAGSRLNNSRAWNDLITIQFGDDRESPILKSELDQCNVFLPHFAKTVEINRSFSILKSRYQVVLEALDHLQTGIFVLTPDGEIVLRNSEADRMLGEQDGLQVDIKNRLKTKNTTGELADAISALSSTAAGEGVEAERIIIVPRKSGKDSYIVTVSPIRDPNAALDRFFHGVFVYVVDPAHTSIVSTRGMSELYGLTTTEDEVCSALCQGFDARKIAEQRNVSYETVRTQVKRLMKKTDVQSRGALIRLALSINIPIRGIK